jgi:flavin-binding protein dodecin
MSEHVYKLLELTGSSTTSSDNAVQVALEKASATLQNLEWFKIQAVRGHTEGGKILRWQVTLKAGFRIED